MTQNQDDTRNADDSDIQDENPDDENSENGFAEIDFG